jgi:hypothetical protein
MKRIHPIAQAEMLAELAVARVVGAMLNIEDLLRVTGRAARWAARCRARPADVDYPATQAEVIEASTALGELLAHRASRLIPGARCLHRALAGRVWLARRGVDAQIVVGFRKRGAIEGHAWLEVQTPDGPRLLFKGAGDGYRESFREPKLAA